MIIKLAIALAIVLIVAAFAAWAFLPPRHLPGNRACRRHPALPRPGHRHHHQTRHPRPDQRGPRRTRPGARLQPPAHRRRAVHVLLVPVEGCEDPATAIRRADAFAFAVSQKGVEDGSFWSAKASDYLRGYFHAAALARYDLRAVAAWVSGADPDVPERILAAAGARQWAHVLSELRSEKVYGSIL